MTIPTTKLCDDYQVPKSYGPGKVWSYTGPSEVNPTVCSYCGKRFVPEGKRRVCANCGAPPPEKRPVEILCRAGTSSGGPG